MMKKYHGAMPHAPLKGPRRKRPRPFRIPHKKRLGNSIIEVLIALSILGIVLPASLGALGNAFVAELRIQESASLASAAEWWFSRLAFPVHRAGIDASPRIDENGKARFEWKTEDLENGAIRITLRVTGHFSAVPLTVSRVY